MVFFIFILSFDVFEGRMKKRHLHLFWDAAFILEREERVVISIIFFFY